MLRTMNNLTALDLRAAGRMIGQTMPSAVPFEPPVVQHGVQRGLKTIINGFRCAVLALASVAFCESALAQEDEHGVVRYAPGATGQITQDLVEMMEQAKKDAIDLKGRLTIQGPSDAPDFDVEAARDAALKNPRVLELLGADGIEDNAPPKDAWINAHAFVFASFSMPPSMLKELMLGAHDMGIPVLFRGFYKNSVFETNDALLRVFGEAADIKGFSIDPTLFHQFDVSAVPSLVLLKDPYEMCATQACAGDDAPVHDRISGSITIPAALEIIERGQGDAAHIAREILDEAKP